MTHHVNRLAVTACCAALSLFLSGCGIATAVAPTEISPARTAELVAPPPPPDISSVGTGGESPYPVYFLKDNKLVAETRYYDRPRASVALLALSFGPIPSEIRQGITSEVGYSSNPISYVSTNAAGIATVELNTEFAVPSLFGTQLAEAFGQIVFTLTSLLAPYRIKKVAFSYGGIPVPAYLPNGSLVLYPVDYTNYAAFATSTS